MHLAQMLDRNKIEMIEMLERNDRNDTTNDTTNTTNVFKKRKAYARSSGKL